MNALEIPDQEVTYRRANVETQFMTSRFDSLTEDVYEPSPPDKVAFSASPATLQDLEDGSSTLLGLSPIQQKQKAHLAGANGSSDTRRATGDIAPPPQAFVPTGEVPDAREVGYRQVNPMFESCEPAKVIFQTVQHALKVQDVEFSCSQDWTGDELKFLALTDNIRKECRAIDKDLLGLPELSFDIMADWSSPGELFPGSLSVDSQELSLLLLELNSESPPFTRYEVAKRLKELCQYDSNRRALADLLKDQFVTCLQSMLKDDNEDIVRFAIFAILNFADDLSALNE
ncbi:hypothetical protein BBJ28_00010205 [Nothophytophthora sp. Chile5]|nr:hypothetical protein BBJ28_00010205 [Nothophytophthora sp. Chile5]